MKFSKRGIIIIIVLVVLAIVGFGGYGVYSYYSTEGTFGNYLYDEENDITYETRFTFDKKFDPRVLTDDNNDSSFLSSGGYIDLECGNMESDGYASCIGQVKVINDGSDPIRVEVSDAEYCIDYSDCDALENSNFNWSSTTIDAGQFKMLNLMLRIPMVSGEELTEETGNWHDGSSKQVSVSYKLTAANHIE